MDKIPGIRVILAVVFAAVPLTGVLWGGWDVREVLLLYWVENVVIGFWQVVKMGTSRGPKEKSKWFLIPFFVFHYGAFCAGHAVFIFSLTDDAAAGGGGVAGVLLAILALFASHGLRTWDTFFTNGKFWEVGPDELFMEPYKHIVVIHVGIVLGGALAMGMKDAMPVLILIVVGKLVIDLRGIAKEKREMAKPAISPAS